MPNHDLGRGRLTPPVKAEAVGPEKMWQRQKQKRADASQAERTWQFMSRVTLRCPHCGFSKEMEADVLPIAGTTTSCPRCKGRFPLPKESRPARQDETSSSSLPISDQALTEPVAAPDADRKLVECDLCKKKFDAEEVVKCEEVEGAFLCRRCHGKVSGAGTPRWMLRHPAKWKSTSGRDLPERLEAPQKASSIVKNRHWKIDRTSRCYPILLLLIAYLGVLYLIGFDYVKIYWVRSIFIPIVFIVTTVAFNNENLRDLLADNFKKHFKKIIFVVTLTIVSAIRNLHEYIYLVIMFGPSFAGFIIALLTSSKPNVAVLKLVLLFSALFLHGISAFMLRAAVGLGEAWSGYSSSHTLPTKFFFWGSLALVFLSFVRSKPMRAISDLFHVETGRWIVPSDRNHQIV